MRHAPKPWEEAYRRQGRLWRGERLDAPTRDALAQTPALAHGRWLDAGCGDGKGLVPLCRALAPDAPQPVGADASRWGLRRAREALEASGCVARLVQGDARAWPLRDSAFDAVRAVHLLGHLDDAGRAAATAELARVVRPHGLLVVAEFGRGDFRHGTGREIEPGSFQRGVGIVTHYFDGAELERLLVAAGLRIERLEAERFTVTYEGQVRPRERWWAHARRA